ncbi:hypothetical protein QVD17_19818 [Tagetes erecta]|uniref:Uncharacterized protein n=1 Tax=Tagetes erecta TaxID=13708 RepID=A0AAD8NWT4_TARER|nr:hypothetical protein QVD17_19818 [Tagetes erecta]
MNKIVIYKFLNFEHNPKGKVKEAEQEVIISNLKYALLLSIRLLHISLASSSSSSLLARCLNIIVATHFFARRFLNWHWLKYEIHL